MRKIRLMLVNGSSVDVTVAEESVGEVYAELEQVMVDGTAVLDIETGDGMIHLPGKNILYARTVFTEAFDDVDAAEL